MASMSENDFFIWEGIYRSFQETGGDENAFNSEIWVRKIAKQAEESLQAMRQADTVPTVALSRDYILPVVAALVDTNDGKVCILDFGGGLGTSYLSTLAAIPDSKNVEFHIVERESVCSLGGELFEEYPLLQFHVGLPSLDGAVDIVHAGSSLHYVEDWKSILASLVDYSPRYLIFSDIPAGDIKTFVTTQNFYGRKIPVWFWNIDEFISTVEEDGFRLVYRCRYLSMSPLVQQSMMMLNFPKEYRLGCTCQLLFEVS